MKTWTQKYEAIYEDLKEYFLIGEKMCIGCMVEKYWKVNPTDDGFDVYVGKQRKIVDKLKKDLHDLSGEDLEGTHAKNLYRRMDHLYLMAVDSCATHSNFRNYKILDSAADHEIISNLTAQRIEGLMVRQEERVHSAIKVFPVIFKNRIRYLKGNVPYLLKNKKEDEKRKRQS